ncbi:MAG TPA: CDP-archaeol synthase [Levilinea sp.]|nr:CDP-archaeol synthase [Levilinea sp.]
MLKERLLVVIIGLPILIAVITTGGWLFTLVMTAVLGVAAWEFWRLFSHGGFAPSRPILVGGVILLAFTRGSIGFQYADLIATGLILVGMAVQVFRFARHVKTAATDFCITMAGILYLGWLGAYFFSLRSLPEGQWWFLVALPAVWLADAGAFLFGRKFGRHRMAPLVSPNKTWEGYVGGIITATLLTPLLAALWQLAAPGIRIEIAAVLGFVIAIVSPLGDLGESMIKRQIGVKDSSNILPGHGGMMDRLDTWIWAAAIGYYLILWM